MATVAITIDTGNAAFEHHPGGEIARILREIARQFDDNETVIRKLFDLNGNAVGSCTVTN